MKPNNPPAFPEIVSIDHPENSQMVQYVNTAGGMSLRDYFAAKALVGLLSCPLVRKVTDESQNPTAIIASEAFEYADAMLAEREKQ